MRYFSSFDGVKIAYQIWGTAGTLPPVVLHHGFIVNASINWVAPGVVTALTNAGRQVVALDARGHGASDKPRDPGFYGFEKMAGDVRQLFDIVGSAQIDLVGYSMGAIVSLVAASQDRRIRRLVVGGVGAGVVEPGGGDSRTNSGNALVAALQPQDPARITDPVARAFRAFADSVGADREALVAQAEALAAQATARHRSRIPLNQITAPTLVIAGDNDPLAGRPEVLAASIANAQTLLLPGDHLSVVRLPDFATAIVEFLAS